MKGSGVCRPGFVLVFAVSAVIAGCSSALIQIGNVNTSKDSRTGITADRMVANPLSCAKDSIMGGTPTIGLLLQRSYGRDYKVGYQLIASWVGSGWGYIEAGESLVLMVDGRRMGFYGPGSAEHRVVEGSYVNEECWYPSNYEQLQVIAGAKEVTLELKGKNATITRCLTPTNLDNFKVFVKYFPPYIAIEGPSFR